MTHIKKTCLFVIGLMIIIAWSAPLQARQMTDGNYFIFNDVLGGGITSNSTENGHTVNAGMLGQALTNIGTNQSIAEGGGFTFTMNAGFGFTAKKNDTPLVNFIKQNITKQEDDGEFNIILALDRFVGSNVTATISVTAETDDYTIVYGGNPQVGDIDVVFAEDLRETLTFQIKDEAIMEGDKNYILTITNVVGDAKIGYLNSQVVTISANDNYPLTGVVTYFGSQTGDLIIVAEKEERTFVSDDPWVSGTHSQNFSIDVEPGSYTLYAFISTRVSGEVNYTKNSWEPIIYKYTHDNPFNVPDDIGDNIAMTLDDPAHLYDSPFVGPDLIYNDWVTLFPQLANTDPDEDFDRDGYTNFQEFINGTDPTVVDNAYAYDGYDPGFDSDATAVDEKYQIVFTNPLIPTVGLADGDSFLVDVKYTTSDVNTGTTGLGLAIHFNSTMLDFAGFSNVLTQGAAEDVGLTYNVLDEDDPDTWHKDDYADTDAMVTIGWVENPGSRDWPGLNAVLPLKLCTIKFTVKSNAQGITYGDTSVIRFTATSRDTDYQFYSSPTVVNINDFNFDVDGNGKAEALNDGILIVRYMFEVLKNSSQADVIAPDALRTSASQIWTFLNNGKEHLDIDDNDEIEALQDGLMILRYMFDIDNITENALGEGAQRTTNEEIIPYIKQHLPLKGVFTIPQ